MRVGEVMSLDVILPAVGERAEAGVDTVLGDRTEVLSFVGDVT